MILNILIALFLFFVVLPIAAGIGILMLGLASVKSEPQESQDQSIIYPSTNTYYSMYYTASTRHTKP
jgi:hypothetical protein